MKKSFQIFLAVISFIVIYSCLYFLGMKLYFSPGHVATMWPPSGFVLGLLLIFPKRYWKYLIGLQAATHFVISCCFLSFPIPFSLLDIIDESTGTLISALVFCYFTSGPVNLRDLKHIVWLGLATLVGESVGSIFGVFAVLSVSDSTHYISIWRVWCFADFIGDLLFAPALIGLSEIVRRRNRWLTPKKTLEFVLIILATILGIQWFFGSPSSLAGSIMGFPYLIIPFLIWAVLRFRQHVIPIPLMILGTGVIYYAGMGLGPFAGQNLSPNEVVLSVQLFLVVIGFTFLVMSALMEERRHALAALSESQVRYKNLYHGLIDVSYQTDLKGNFLSISPSALDLFGYKPEEVLGRRIANFYKDPAKRDEFVALLLRDAIVKNFEAEIRRKDGAIIWVSTNARLLMDEAGNPIGVEGITRDVSQIKKAENEKELLEGRLRQSQKMEAIGTLAGGIAHDFNNILAAVLGYSDLLRRSFAKDSKERKNLDSIYSAASRAKDLTRQILLFSRKAPKTEKTIRIDQHVRAAAVLLEQTIPSTVQLFVHINEKTGFVYADETELHQVVLNLGTNAFQALPNEKGVIRISLEPLEIGSEILERFPNLKTGRFAQITVQDNGRGMDSNMITRIFEPYFTTKEKGKGTGMGLSVVHGIITSLGGAIHVDSKKDVGTTFSVFIPLIEAPTKEEDSFVKSELPVGTETILLVDDEPALVNLWQQELTGLGYKVIASTSALEALDLFKKEPEAYSLIISDQTMPDLHGDDLAQQAMELRPDIPVIICTGHSATLNFDKAEQLGIKCLLMKPVDVRDMAQTIRETLDDQ